MIDKVEPTTRGLSLLPTRGHGAQVHPRHPLASDVPGYPGVVPRGHAAAKVMEVDLALLSCPHLVALRQVVRLVKNCPGHEPDHQRAYILLLNLKTHLLLVASPAPAGM